ncbi:MAG: hypothetical protein A2W25_13240 [candidate division Zixibacteria bacterium RBG_16_53_22]|nr:MAG: hypothetical protein A2W25_13240 [candidate division Zixibacteria bacterium RBG_16_53_22]
MEDRIASSVASGIIGVESNGNLAGRFSPDRDLRRVLYALGVAGGAAFVIGAAISALHAWRALLMSSFLLISFGLAATLFIAIQYVTGAAWCVAIRRVPEAISSVIPWAALGIAAVIIVKPDIYPWSAQPEMFSEAAWFKRLWLSQPFFTARTILYLLSWIIISRAIVRNSRLQDDTGDIAYTRKNIRLSALFVALFAVTFCLASFDWIMSLEPEWYSTIFAVYNFAGLFVGGLAAIIILTVWMDRLGPLRGILNREHLHDLGKLLFAFSTFWMYIWFSQYMLIWYTNFPEETVYYLRRIEGAWGTLFVLNMFLNWVVPFLALLPKATKRNPSALIKVAYVVVAGRILDLYLMIAAPFANGGPKIGIIELVMILGSLSLFLLIFIKAFRNANSFPTGDPFLAESRHYHR